MTNETMKSQAKILIKDIEEVRRETDKSFGEVVEVFKLVAEMNKLLEQGKSAHAIGEIRDTLEIRM